MNHMHHKTKHSIAKRNIAWHDTTTIHYRTTQNTIQHATEDTIQNTIQYRQYRTIRYRYEHRRRQIHRYRCNTTSYKTIQEDRTQHNIGQTWTNHNSTQRYSTRHDIMHYSTRTCMLTDRHLVLRSNLSPR